MAPVVVEEKHLKLAELAGACGSVKSLKPGTPLHKISSEHLYWFAEKYPQDADYASRMALEEAGIKGTVPLDLLGSGYGYGYG